MSPDLLPPPSAKALWEMTVSATADLLQDIGKPEAPKRTTDPTALVNQAIESLQARGPAAAKMGRSDLRVFVGPDHAKVVTAATVGCVEMLTMAGFTIVGCSINAGGDEVAMGTIVISWDLA